MNDPRNLYYDLGAESLGTDSLQFYQAQRMSRDPAWVPVVDCFKQPCPVQTLKIAITKCDGADQTTMVELAQRYQDNLTRLQNVLVQDYPVQTVPSTARIDEAIDVFDRINSQGTKLSQAELALAHVAGKWPTARREMKQAIEEYAARGFTFDLTFMVRALTVVVKCRALFETIHDAERSELVAGWTQLRGILRYMVSMLPTWASVHSTDDLSTTNVLVPAIGYLSRTGGRFETEGDIRRFVRWLYAASTWARYTSQTDQRLEHDVSVATQGADPWPELVNAIIDQRGRIEMKAADLEGRGVQQPFYRMTFILAKLNGAIDWYNGQPLTTSHTTPWHSHHIFPSAVLYKDGGLSPESHVDRQKVNEIANRAFLSANSNIKIQDTPPEEALKQVEERYPGALQKQFVPLNRDLWKLENYGAFLAKRREMIAAAYNDVMNCLAGPVEEAPRVSVPELVAQGESGAVEFKSTLRWDVRQGTVNRELQKVIAKTVAGFLNTEGGTLLIGVVDDGSIYGIEQDMQTLGKKNVDGFELALRDTVGGHLGAEFGPYVQASFEPIDGHTVCRVEIDRSPKPAYLHSGAATEFYIRSGNTTQMLDMETAHEYIGMHWEA